MSKSMLINVVQEEESRVAIVDAGVLDFFEIETLSTETLKGNIYKAVVENVNPSLEAAFVNCGWDRPGFLPLDEVNFKVLPTIKTRKGGSRILEHVQPGMEFLVQVIRDRFDSKPPSLTTYYSLPGRYLVLTPVSDGSGISRRIEDEEQRAKLRKMVDDLRPPEGYGVIVRTAGLDQERSELVRDMGYLLRLWETVEKASSVARAPSLIYRERDLALRTIRDHLTDDIEEVLIDDAEVHENAIKFIRAVAPHQEPLIKLYTGDKPVFTRFNLEEQIETIYKRRVPLKSGGEIVIEETEAMTAIDVNSSRSREASAEEMAHRTNLEAAGEIGRQLRLRDLGGLIVIDFIDMESPKHLRAVEKAVQTSMKSDKAKYDATRISKLGIMEISRQRLKAAKARATYVTCPACDGAGTVRTTEAAALAALRRIQTRIVRGDVGSLKATLPSDVALYLLNQKREELMSLESRYGAKIALVPRPDYAKERCEIETTAREGPPPWMLPQPGRGRGAGAHAAPPPPPLPPQVRTDRDQRGPAERDPDRSREGGRVKRAGAERAGAERARGEEAAHDGPHAAQGGEEHSAEQRAAQEFAGWEPAKVDRDEVDAALDRLTASGARGQEASGEGRQESGARPDAAQPRQELFGGRSWDIPRERLEGETFEADAQGSSRDRGETSETMRRRSAEFDRDDDGAEDASSERDEQERRTGAEQASHAGVRAEGAEGVEGAPFERDREDTFSDLERGSRPSTIRFADDDLEEREIDDDRDALEDAESRGLEGSAALSGADQAGPAGSSASASDAESTVSAGAAKRRRRRRGGRGRKKGGPSEIDRGPAAGEPHDRSLTARAATGSRHEDEEEEQAEDRLAWEDAEDRGPEDVARPPERASSEPRSSEWGGPGGRPTAGSLQDDDEVDEDDDVDDVDEDEDGGERDESPARGSASEAAGAGNGSEPGAEAPKKRRRRHRGGRGRRKKHDGEARTAVTGDAETLSGGGADAQHRAPSSDREGQIARGRGESHPPAGSQRGKSAGADREREGGSAGPRRRRRRRGGRGEPSPRNGRSHEESPDEARAAMPPSAARAVGPFAERPGGEDAHASRVRPPAPDQTPRPTPPATPPAPSSDDEVPGGWWSRLRGSKKRGA